MRGLAAFAAALALWSGLAHANGAFPDGLQVLVDGDRFALGTNFGVVRSAPDGWRYACEAAITAGVDVGMYASGGAGLIAIAGSGLFTASPEACGWTAAAGSLAGRGVTDAFADPNDASHVVAIALTADYRSALHESHDGGRTFSGPLWTTSALLMSVEIARADGTLYATTWDGRTSPGISALWRLTGAAPAEIATFEPGRVVRIAAVDRTNSGRLYLRSSPIDTVGGDALVISDAANGRVTPALAFEGPMGGFHQTEDGTLYVGERAGRIHVRRPESDAFESQDAPRVRCLGGNADQLLVCGDAQQGEALLYRWNGGDPEPIVWLDELKGPLECVGTPGLCAAHWATLSALIAQLPPRTSVDGGPSEEVDGGGTRGPSNGGCGCRPGAGSAMALVMGFCARRRRER